MKSEEREIAELKESESLFRADNLKEAKEKVHQAMGIAKGIGNKELLGRTSEFIRRFSYYTEIQTVELGYIETNGFILDIGGEEREQSAS